MNNYSSEHTYYLNNKKREKRKIIFFRFLIILVFLISWQLLSVFNIINSFLFSSPLKLLNTTIDLFFEGNLIYNISITIFEVFICSIISFFLSIVFSYFLWNFKLLSKILDPFIAVLNSLPKVALGPLIIIWVGSGISSIIFMAILISFFVATINIYNSFISVNKDYILLMKIFKSSKWMMFKKCILPSNISNLISIFKVNVSMNFIGVIMGELLVSKNGIGYLIMYGSQIFNIDLVLTGVIILGLFSSKKNYIRL